MNRAVDVVAALLAIGAGIYLLQSQSVGNLAEGESWFEVLAHGIGVYFIARGLWMLSHAGRQHDVIDRLDRLIAIEEDELDDEPEPVGRGATA